MRSTLAVLFALVATLPASADPPSDVAKTEMAKLSRMVGKWKGSGWRAGPEGRSAFDSEEVVELRLGGRALLIEGSHYATGTKNSVHHALAILAWDLGRSEYRLQSALASGSVGTFPGKLEEGRFVWSIQNPTAPSLRFSVSVDDPGRWVELGEFSGDGGKTWTKFFEMTLSRVQ